MDPIIKASDLNLWYKNFHALKGVNLEIEEKKVTALIGPSGCGKSTFLRTLNRLNDEIDGVRIQGEVLFRNQNITEKNLDVVDLRRQIGMVFQQPNPFLGMSILENLTIGPKLNKLIPPVHLRDWAVECLKKAHLWNETKDKLHGPASALSGGQQQRLCIARALSTRPQVILMDEPTSALDPIATGGIEELITELRQTVTVIIVTHSLQQARRISDKVSFFVLGEIIETNDTASFFSHPVHELSKNYVEGRIG